MKALAVLKSSEIQHSALESSPSCSGNARKASLHADMSSCPRSCLKSMQAVKQSGLILKHAGAGSVQAAMMQHYCYATLTHLQAPQGQLAAAHGREPRRRGLRHNYGRQRAHNQNARLRGRLEAAHPAARAGKAPSVTITKYCTLQEESRNGFPLLSVALTWSRRLVLLKGTEIGQHNHSSMCMQQATWHHQLGNVSIRLSIGLLQPVTIKMAMLLQGKI